MFNHTAALPWYASFSLQITKSDTRLQIKWAVSLAIADSHFYFSSGICVWVCMG